jgi:hypothetical protein
VYESNTPRCLVNRLASRIFASDKDNARGIHIRREALRELVGVRLPIPTFRPTAPLVHAGEFGASGDRDKSVISGPNGDIVKAGGLVSGVGHLG